MKTLAEIMARCHEDGDCMIWGGATMRDGRPICMDNRKRGSVRQIVWRLVHGKPTGGRYVVMTCRNKLCLNPGHMIALTPKQSINFTRTHGGLNETIRTAHTTRYAQEFRSKLDWEKVREIRSSTETNIELGKKFGVHHSLISKVRLGQAWRQQARGSSVFNL